ncbi:MAG TPA: hypothetical protein VN784_04930 [Candidatus Limnocylindrales bacterium]|nr:hypothetical protein [Candidatus Limnocylindrales bacterium]
MDFFGTPGSTPKAFASGLIRKAIRIKRFNHGWTRMNTDSSFFDAAVLLHGLAERQFRPAFKFSFSRFFIRVYLCESVVEVHARLRFFGGNDALSAESALSAVQAQCSVT